ncbi:unnamed protein product [Durusdinium trenchii]|uniref:Uncharacterized protein n=1 Tax=Durusdinium trenchii TaxID=1381693 RepID=A0ABP0NLE8_9DINO
MPIHVVLRISEEGSNSMRGGDVKEVVGVSGSIRRVVTFKILAAEQEVKKMGDVATPLPGMGQPGEKLAEFFYETLQEASQSDKVAQASVAAARKLLLHKTAELKKLAMAGGDRSGSGGELGRLQTRVNSMQQEIAKFRSNISNAEERFRVKEQLVEVMDKLQMVEGEVEKVAANDIPEQEYSPELVQEADKANTSVKMKLEQLAKLLEIKQRSAGGVLLEELTAMQQRNKKAEKKLERVMQAATERKQQLQASEMVGQSLEQVERSELELQKAVQADWPFQSSFEDAPLQTMQTALAESEAACLQTQKAISEARGLILEHLAKAKDFQGVVQDFCSKELVVLQKRLDQMASKLGELKKEGTERKRKVQLRSTAEKISEVEASVQQLTSLVQRLGQEASSSLSKAQAQERCEEGYALEETAKKLVDGAKRFLTQREAEAKTLAETHRLPFMTDLAKLRSRLTTAQVNLSKLSKELTEYEHGYVAKQLAQDVSSELTRLNKETEVALQACSALLEEEGHRKVLQALRQDALVEALQEELKSQSIEDLWAGLSNGPSVSEEDFRVWLQTRLEARPFSTPITEEQIRDVWPLLTNSAEPGSASAGRPGLSEATLKELLRERRHVTGAAAQLWDAPEGGEELGQLYEGEGLEVLEANSGERLQGRLLRDSRTFWVPSSALSASTGATKLQSLVAYIKAITANCDFSAKQTQQKGAQVITLKTGPLVAVGNQLLEASKKFMEEKDKLEALKEKLTLAKDAAVREHEAEVKELESAKCQAFAEKSLAKAKGEVQQANHAVQEVGSKDLSPEQVQELPPSELEALLKKSEGAEEALNTAKATIEEVRLSFEGFKGPKKLMLQVRVELERLKKVLKVSQQAWEGNHQQISTTCAQVRKRLKMRARQALRMCFRQAELSAESAFQQVARRDPKRVSHQEFLRFVENLPDAHGTKVSSEQAELIFQDFETSGMEKVHFFKAVQEYAVCIKEISMTSDFHIQISDRLRKLLAQEVVEIFEGPRDDEEAAVQRVRCRALKDGQVGWVTTKGNQGTAFLKPREKPVLQVLREADLREMMPLDAAKLGQLQVDEKLELLEGPREETFQPQIFLQSDDGFVSLEALEATGTTCSTKHFVCRATIAMTDVHDISDCKVLGKIHVGELLEAVDEPEPPLVDDEAAPATTSGRVTQPSSTSSGSKTLPRRRFRSKTLEKEGWVTLQGNAGTVYLEQSVQHFVLCGPVPLLSSPNKDGLLKRMLEEGELLAVKQKVTKTIPPQVMMQVRSLDDARRSGWLSFVAGPDAPVKPWVERSSAG